MGRAATLGWLCATLLACTDVDQGEGDTEGPASCMHGMFSECACPDGTMGQQLCAHDTSGFEPCMCGGTDEASAAETTPADDDGGSSGPADTGVDPGSSSDEGDPGTTGGDASSSGAETTPLGEPPTAAIHHPGTEDRQVGVPIPFAGMASDPEDGPLSGASMVWTDSLEGVLGEGEAFEAALLELGEHTVTLTATDADGNIGEDSLTFTIVP